MRRALLSALALAAPLVFAAAPATAAFNVCNKTNLTARVALGRFDGTNWTSEGWWTIAAPKLAPAFSPGRWMRAIIISMPPMARAGTWEGNTHFCVAPDAKFKAPGRGDCGSARL